MAALEERIINFTTYSRAVGALSIQRHDYVSVNADVLLHIAGREDRDELPRLAAALGFIGTPSAENPSHFKVGWDSRHSGRRPKLQRYIRDWARGRFIMLEKSSSASPAASQKSTPKKGKKKHHRGRRRR